MIDTDLFDGMLLSGSTEEVVVVVFNLELPDMRVYTLNIKPGTEWHYN